MFAIDTYSGIVTRSKRKELETIIKDKHKLNIRIKKYNNDEIDSDDEYIPETPYPVCSRHSSVSSDSSISKNEVESLIEEANKFIYGNESIFEEEDEENNNEVDIQIDSNIQNQLLYDMASMMSDIPYMRKCRQENYIKKFGDNIDDYDKEYIKMCHQVSDVKPDQNVTYFMSLKQDEKKRILEMENDIKKEVTEDVPIRFKILNMPVTLRTKLHIMRKLETLEMLDTSNSEYHKIGEWINTLQSVPFNIYKDLEITKQNEHHEIQKYLINVKKILDDAVYGHIEAKTQILQVVTKWISNPKCKGNVIALKGPMGNGKTTLVREGICKALNRPFAFMPLGGAKDSSYLEGYGYTYEGSECGRIVKILVESKCMNPVIYFDELDKVSDNSKGEEIINKLIHITDHSQNTAFRDIYFSGIDFDISRALFIFSFNDETKLNPILKDRMHIIEMKKLDTKQKYIIAKNYIIPQLCNDIGFKKDDIIIENDVIDYIINNYTNEEGVRELKRCLENIISRINILKYTSNSEELEMSFSLPEFKLPLNITITILDKILKKKQNDAPFMFYT